MKYYYHVDRYETVWNKRGAFREWSAFIPDDSSGASIELNQPVFLVCKFADQGMQDYWESSPGIESLGDPLENDEVSDSHMQKMAKTHKMMVVPDDPDPGKPGPIVIDGVTVDAIKVKAAKDGRPGRPLFVDKLSKEPLTRNHKVREYAKRIADLRDPAFKFKIF
jgi:hypothetical protein